MNNWNVDPCLGPVTVDNDNVSGIHDSLDEEGEVNDFNLYFNNFNDDPAAMTMFPLHVENDQFARSTFAPVENQDNNLSTPAYDNNIMNALSHLGKAVPEEKQVLDHEIESFYKLYPTPKFDIPQTRNVKFENQSIIIAKKGEAIKIEVTGANIRKVKVSVRNKADLHYNEAVQSCLNHRDDKPHPDASFYIGPKVEVKYDVEDGHHIAIVEVLGQDSPGFAVVFRCWTSCNKMYGKEQELVLTAYDDEMICELHKAKYSLRICENVIRDSRNLGKDKVSKRRRSSNSLKAQYQPYPVVKRENETIHEYQDEEPSSVLGAAAPLPNTRCFMVEINDDLVPVLQALAKVGGKLTEISGRTSRSLRSAR